MPAPQAGWMRHLARERFRDFVLRAPRRVGQARCQPLIDGICEAICAAWEQWQSQAVLSGVVIEGAIARGASCWGRLWGR
jgi:hypothetical protein